MTGPLHHVGNRPARLLILAASLAIGGATAAIEANSEGGGSNAIFGSRDGMERFLSDVRRISVAGDPADICRLFSYPIQVSDHSKKIRIGNLEECYNEKNLILKDVLISKLKTVTLSNIEAAHSMNMVFNGLFWIDKVYISYLPIGEHTSPESFDDDRLWQYRIVDINF